MVSGYFLVEDFRVVDEMMTVLLVEKEVECLDVRTDAPHGTVSGGWIVMEMACDSYGHVTPQPANVRGSRQWMPAAHSLLLSAKPNDRLLLWMTCLIVREWD